MLAALSLLAVFFGYNRLHRISEKQRMLEETSRLADEIERMVINGNVGEESSVQIEISSGYRLRYEPENRQLEISGTRIPENGFEYPVSIPSEEFGPGEHLLSIEVEKDRILVKEVD